MNTSLQNILRCKTQIDGIFDPPEGLAIAEERSLILQDTTRVDIFLRNINSSNDNNLDQFTSELLSSCVRSCTTSRSNALPSDNVCRRNKKTKLVI